MEKNTAAAAVASATDERRRRRKKNGSTARVAAAGIRSRNGRTAAEVAGCTVTVMEVDVVAVASATGFGTAHVYPTGAPAHTNVTVPE
jgi:hypothetical protein